MEFGEYFAIVYQNCSKLELQIRGGMGIFQGYYFLFLKENVCCVLSVELFQ